MNVSYNHKHCKIQRPPLNPNFLICITLHNDCNYKFALFRQTDLQTKHQIYNLDLEYLII